MEKWLVGYVVGNTYKYKYVMAGTESEAIKKARVKNIDELAPVREFNESASQKLVDAIKKFAENEKALENFGWYLEKHFDVWLDTYAHNPSCMASEFKHFAEMEF